MTAHERQLIKKSEVTLRAYSFFEDRDLSQIDKLMILSYIEQKDLHHYLSYEDIQENVIHLIQLFAKDLKERGKEVVKATTGDIHLYHKTKPEKNFIPLLSFAGYQKALAELREAKTKLEEPDLQDAEKYQTILEAYGFLEDPSLKYVDKLLILAYMETTLLTTYLSSPKIKKEILLAINHFVQNIKERSKQVVELSFQKSTPTKAVNTQIDEKIDFDKIIRLAEKGTFLPVLLKRYFDKTWQEFTNAKLQKIELEKKKQKEGSLTIEDNFSLEQCEAILEAYSFLDDPQIRLFDKYLLLTYMEQKFLDVGLINPETRRKNIPKIQTFAQYLKARSSQEDITYSEQNYTQLILDQKRYELEVLNGIADSSLLKERKQMLELLSFLDDQGLSHDQKVSLANYLHFMDLLGRFSSFEEREKAIKTVHDLIQKIKEDPTTFSLSEKEHKTELEDREFNRFLSQMDYESDEDSN